MKRKGKMNPCLANTELHTHTKSHVSAVSLGSSRLMWNEAGAVGRESQGRILYQLQWEAFGWLHWLAFSFSCIEVWLPNKIVRYEGARHDDFRMCTCERTPPTWLLKTFITSRVSPSFSTRALKFCSLEKFSHRRVL